MNYLKRINSNMSHSIRTSIPIPRPKGESKQNSKQLSSHRWHNPYWDRCFYPMSFPTILLDQLCCDKGVQLCVFGGNFENLKSSIEVFLRNKSASKLTRVSIFAPYAHFRLPFQRRIILPGTAERYSTRL